MLQALSNGCDLVSTSLPANLRACVPALLSSAMQLHPQGSPLGAIVLQLILMPKHRFCGYKNPSMPKTISEAAPARCAHRRRAVQARKQQGRNDATPRNPGPVAPRGHTNVKAMQPGTSTGCTLKRQLLITQTPPWTRPEAWPPPC